LDEDAHHIKKSIHIVPQHGTKCPDATANLLWANTYVSGYEMHDSVGMIETIVRLLLQPLRWRCLECVIHHERDVREEQHYIYVARTSNNRVIMACELCCCLLPQCEALRTCRSGFPIATLLTHAVWI